VIMVDTDVSHETEKRLTALEERMDNLEGSTEETTETPDETTDETPDTETPDTEDEVAL